MSRGMAKNGIIGRIFSVKLLHIPEEQTQRALGGLTARLQPRGNLGAAADEAVTDQVGDTQIGEVTQVKDAVADEDREVTVILLLFQQLVGGFGGGLVGRVFRSATQARKYRC